MKIKYWLIVVSLVCLSGCTAAIVSALTPDGGGSSGGLLNLFILNGLIRPSGGGTTAIATYDFTSGIPTGWTGTWTSTSSSCPATGTVPCLRSAVTADSQSSSLSFTTTLKATKISFKRRVSSEYGYDTCKFTIDGLNITGEGFGVSGTDDKLYEFVFSEAASRTFAWTYSKDSGGIGGFDLCSLDDVVLYGVSSDISGTDTTSGYSTSTAFSNLNNPNGVWSYGFKSTVTGTFTAYTKSFNYGTYNSWYNVFDNPSFMYNYSNSTVYGVAPKESSLHPGSSGEISVLRWTAPKAGTISIKGSFKAGDTGAVDVYVLKNTTTLFSKTSTLITESYDQTTTVAIGDTVDFQVGNAGNFTSDATPIDGVIAYATAGTTSCTVSTFAGSGTAGSTDGTGTAASFNTPTGVVADNNGNVFVADQLSNKIRKITSAGLVTTFAGSSSGSSDGTGVAAQFNYPYGITVDGSGNLYVTDKQNAKIRKITSTAVVTTLAGSGSYAFTDGTGIAASFYTPLGITIDSSGTLYVADYYKIRKVTSAGVVSSLAGSGSFGSTDATGAAASFHIVSGIVLNSSGDAYVTDQNNCKIRKVTSAGVVTTFAVGVCGTATETVASVGSPLGITADGKGSFIISDGSRILRLTSSAVVTKLAGGAQDTSSDGLGTDGSADKASFKTAVGIAVDSNGTIYVADANNNKIRKLVNCL